ncbi:MAG: hypothetical protein JWP34_4736 [Massilia sp.]|nr:hypothetical protein [Massilia sp.]
MNSIKMKPPGYALGGLFVPIVRPEACYRFVQIGKGLAITCRCSRCRARDEAAK